MLKAEVEWFHEDLQDLIELTPKNDVLFFIGDWNAKVGSQETPGMGREVGGGIGMGNTCKSMADSFQCMTKPTKIKKKKKTKKKKKKRNTLSNRQMWPWSTV